LGVGLGKTAPKPKALFFERKIFSVKNRHSPPSPKHMSLSMSLSMNMKPEAETETETRESVCSVDVSYREDRSTTKKKGQKG
jgi:hypothetical protein